MPDFLSHSLFAREVLRRGGYADEAGCREHMNLYRLGAQGPDLLYYLSAVCGLERAENAGDILHGLSFGDLAAVKKEYAGDLSAEAYICGYETHLVLDGFAHPYVERRAAEMAGERGISEECAHVRLEVLFEARQYYEITGSGVNRYIVRGDLTKSRAERALVSEINLKLLSRLTDVKISRRDMETTMRRLPFAYMLVFDKHGIARFFTDAAAFLSGHDFAARWHIKRSYGMREKISDEDYAELTRLYNRALAEY